MKPKIPEWMKYYPLPLKLDEMGCFAFASDGTMALDFDDDININEAKLIVDIINGKNSLNYSIVGLRMEDISFFGTSTIKGTSTKKVPIFDIRGWGNLTGIGGHNLPEEKAIQIQNQFAGFVFERLSNKKQNS